MSTFKDLTNRNFGRLHVKHRDLTSKYTKWVCEFDCGKITSVRSCHLLSGAVISCGCLSAENTSIRNHNQKTIHGLRGTRLYSIWHSMKQRCYDTSRSDYDRYGGRGITVCDEWKEDFKSFYDWSISHGYSDNLTIDRKDNDKGYSPENCQWVTRLEQTINRRNTINITVGDLTHTITEWCSILNVSYHILYRKYKEDKAEEFIRSEVEEESNDC